MGHAKSLLGVDNPKIQLKLANKIIEQDLSVRQIETKVQQLNSDKKNDPKSKESIDLPDTHFRVIELVGKYFNNNISIKRTPKGSGNLTIHFKSDKEIEQFLSILEKNEQNNN